MADSQTAESRGEGVSVPSWCVSAPHPGYRDEMVKLSRDTQRLLASSSAWRKMPRTKAEY